MFPSGRGQNFSADPARYRLIFDIAGCIDTRVSDFEKLSAPLPAGLPRLPTIKAERSP